MPFEAAGDDDEATEATLALPPASRLKRRQPTSRQRSRPRRQRGRHPCWWWAGRPSETRRTPLGMLVARRLSFAVGRKGSSIASKSAVLSRRERACVRAYYKSEIGRPVASIPQRA